MPGSKHTKKQGSTDSLFLLWPEEIQDELAQVKVPKVLESLTDLCISVDLQ